MTDGGGASPVLVIGVGNDLRADDAVGRWVADQIEACDLPGVTVRSVVQLTPELALDAVGRELVVVVDASVEADELRIEELEPAADAAVMTHHGDPAGLLALVALLGDSPTRALLVSIPVGSLELGQGISPPALAAAQEAVDRLLAVFDGS